MKKFKARNPFKNVSLFAMLCAVVALGYIGYRAFALVGPNGIGVAFSKPAIAVEIGCSQDVDLDLPVSPDKLPLVSTAYQEYLQRQKATGPILTTNYSLEKRDKQGQPDGYYKSAEADYLDYQFKRQAETGVPYLSVETKRQLTDAKDASGSWITDALAVEKNATYVYGLAHRATSPAIVTLEYTMQDGSLQYQPVTKLDANAEWQTFTSVFTNERDAKAVRFLLASRDKGVVDTRNYDMHRIADAQLDKGRISVTFDDGWQSIADHALPLLDQYKIPTTQYIISEASSKSVDQYMNIDTLKQMQKNGHEIGSHTLTHCDQTKLSPTKILNNARDSKTALEAEGLSPIESYAYPYGRYDNTTQPLVSEIYPFMRSSDVGYNDRYFDTRNIRSMVVLDTTTDAEFQSWIDYAKEHKVWLVVAYHRVDESGTYSVSSAQLKRQLEMIADSKLTVEPLAATAKAIHK
jgi:peptidoglycan/xylan/chitin deacetylase (PgdA/CDA1 family)